MVPVGCDFEPDRENEKQTRIILICKAAKSRINPIWEAIDAERNTTFPDL